MRRKQRSAARALALGAVVAAVVVAGYLLLFGGGDGYQVKARFQNASQLVKGNLVQVSGRSVGEVTDIDLTDDGQAEVTLSISDDKYEPLRRGTQAVVRQASLSGIANRYIDLRLAPSTAPDIPDGGTLEQSDTTTAVDLDELFNTLDPDTRKSLQKVIQGSAREYAGEGEALNRGIHYFNPALAASSRLFDELTSDQAELERFVVSSSKLVTDIAERRDDVAGLVDNLATTTSALASQKGPLAESVQRLPDFMRRANTTFLNLRATLDDLDPLVEESKPVVRKLRPFLAQLRPLARDARPALRDLSRTVRTPGADNDLVELTRSTVSVRDSALRPQTVNGARREGAFPASEQALKDATPVLNYWRPYSVDLLGWFDDFSHSGVYDALGAASRAALHVNAFALLDGQLSFIPPELRGAALNALLTRGQTSRCPGSAEHPADDGSSPIKPSPDFPCDPTQVPPGR